MIEIKFHKGISKIYHVSLEKFAEATKEKSPYVRQGKNGKEAYGICPLCETPVRLLGIYAKLDKQRPHARHCKFDVPGLGTFDYDKYVNCPNHKKRSDYVKEIRSSADITDFNREVLALAHDYFDKCIYILKKVTGLVISDNLAEDIALDYMSHPGYMTYDITRENVPYIMGLCMTGKSLVKRLIIKDSPLYEMLKDKKEVSLVLQQTKAEYKKAMPLYKIESNVGYLELVFNISRYRYASSNTSTFREYLKLHIGIPDGNGTYDTYAEKEIEVDPFLFSKLISAKQIICPRKELSDIADRILTINE